MSWPHCRHHGASSGTWVDGARTVEELRWRLWWVGLSESVALEANVALRHCMWGDEGGKGSVGGLGKWVVRPRSQPGQTGHEEG